MQQVWTYAPPEDGLCLCGCGSPTQLADRDRRTQGWVKGKPKPFLPHHKPRRLPFERWTVDPVTRCWNWYGAKADGYAYVSPRANPAPGEKPRKLVHVINYERKWGPVPDGTEFDHLCHTRARDRCPGGPSCPHRGCVNPDHVEPVSDFENSRRGVRTLLTWEQVHAIRALRGKTHFKEVARQFGLRYPTYVHMIWAQKVWKE